MRAHRRLRWLPLTLVALLAVAACGEEAPSAEPDDPEEPSPTEPEDDPDEPDDLDDPGENEEDGADGDGADGNGGEGDDEDSPLGVATRLALEDAAQRTGLDMQEIEVIEAEEVTWSDGAIGCPQPGETYIQALVQGFRIVLDADGDRLHYHAAEGEDPFLCENPEEPGAG